MYLSKKRVLGQLITFAPILYLENKKTPKLLNSNLGFSLPNYYRLLEGLKTHYQSLNPISNQIQKGGINYSNNNFQ